jgi:preprotein translocase subunit SecG
VTRFFWFVTNSKNENYGAGDNYQAPQCSSILSRHKERTVLKKFASMMMVFALLCALGVPVSFARRPDDSDNKSKAAEPATNLLDPAKSEPAATDQPNEKLRAGIDKLVNDTKAGKLMLSAKSQIQPAKSNGLSKGTKIAVGVGIVAAIVLVMVVRHEKETFLDGLRIF